jgi:hypothetical protein
MEDCTNGEDDDGDRLVDCDDPDCALLGMPVLSPEEYTACPALPFTDRVTYNDVNLLNPGFSIFTEPVHGTVTIDQTGKFTYTPLSSDCLTDTFIYQVCNQVLGCCAIAKVTLHLGDSIAPILLNVPADITIGCDELTPTPPVVFGFDSCPGIYISFDEESTEHDSTICDTYFITRTWQATDLCGNSSSGSQLITVKDLTRPEIFRVYTLPNGKKLMAGVAEGVTQTWKYVPFPNVFGQMPVVFSQVITQNELSAVTIRQRNVSTEGFELRLREEEFEDDVHQPENVAWIALEPGAMPGLEAGQLVNVTNVLKTLTFNQFFTTPPAFITSLQTHQDSDPVTVRYNNLALGAAQVFLEEETSKDAETVHGNETMAYLAMEPKRTLLDQNGEFLGETGSLNLTNAWATVTLSRHYNKPAVILGGLPIYDSQPATIRVRNVTSNTFEVRIQEWNYLDGSHAVEPVSYLVVEGSIPAAPEYYCQSNNGDLQQGVNLFLKDNCDHQVGLEYQESSSLQPSGLLILRTWSATDDCGNTTQLSRNDSCAIAALKMKVMLSGAMINNGGGMLMRDDLRQKGLIPLCEPYSTLSGFQHYGGGGFETIDSSMLTITGDNAIVDWVLLEIRDSSNANIVLETTSALVQRDGDVVSTTGDSVIYFPGLQEGHYYVSVRHRNHLGMMTDGTWFVGTSKTPLIDFTKIVIPARGGIEAGRLFTDRRGLWAGDLNGDRKAIYQGPSNDIFNLFIRVMGDPDNLEFLANYIADSYDRNDLNMDGKVIYQGPNNDRALLLYHTVMNHPGNLVYLANFIALEKIP